MKSKNELVNIEKQAVSLQHAARKADHDDTRTHTNDINTVEKAIQTHNPLDNLRKLLDIQWKRLDEVIQSEAEEGTKFKQTEKIVETIISINKQYAEIALKLGLLQRQQDDAINIHLHEGHKILQANIVNSDSIAEITREFMKRIKEMC